MKALILFSTYHGQTQKIANSIASEIRVQHACDVINLNDVVHLDWQQYDRVLIGASIRYGYFQTVLNDFVKQYLFELNRRVSGFFSVNLTARKLEKCSLLTNTYTYKFLKQSPWKPDCCAVFAGALYYPRYHWFDRIMIQLIMRITGGETDLSKEVEYTDWQKVASFAKNFENCQKNRKKKLTLQEESVTYAPS